MAGLFEATQQNVGKGARRNQMPSGPVYDAKYKSLMARDPAVYAQRDKDWRSQYAADAPQRAQREQQRSDYIKTRRVNMPQGYDPNEYMAAMSYGSPAHAERSNRYLQAWGGEGTMAQARQTAGQMGWDAIQPGQPQTMSDADWRARYGNLSDTDYRKQYGTAGISTPLSDSQRAGLWGTPGPQSQSAPPPNIFNVTGNPNNYQQPPGPGNPNTPQGGTSTPQEVANIWNPTGAPPVPQGGTSTPQEVANIWNPTGAPPVPQSGGQPYDNGPQMNMLPQGIGSLLKFLASRKGYGFGGYGGGGGGINRGGQMQSWQIPRVIA